MEEAIVIFNPNEKPFGPLSNNFRNNILIDDKLYNTVSNYVYSLPLKSSTFKRIISEGPTKDILTLRDKFIRDEQISIIKSSLKKSLKVKFINTDLGAALVRTNQSHLVYRSDNTFLGVNKEGQGENLLGLMLMHIRREQMDLTSKITKQIADDRFYSELYDNYLLYSIMKQKIMNGSPDFLKYLQGYKINQVIDSYGRDLIQYESPSKDTVIEIYNKNLLPTEIFEEIRLPGLLPFRLLKKFGLTYINEIQRKVKHRLYNLFTQKVAEKYVPETYNPTYGKHIIEKSISKLSFEEKEKLMERIYALYNSGKLDKTITETINVEFIISPLTEEKIEELKKAALTEAKPGEKLIVDNLDQEDVEHLGEVLGEVDSLKQFIEDRKAFNIMFPNLANDDVRRDAREIWKAMSPEDKKPFFDILRGTISETLSEIPLYNPLQPEINFTDEFENDPNGFLSNDFPFMMTINYLKYPSVTHFVTANLFTNLSYVSSIIQAHPYLLADPVANPGIISSYKMPRVILKEYYDRLEDDIAGLTINGVIKALDIKFSNGEMASLLLATGNVPIINEDFADPILGVGPNKDGQNVTGKHLEFLRRKIQEEGVHQPAVITIQPTPSIGEIVKEDAVIMKWFTDRTGDIVNSIIHFTNYLKSIGFQVSEIDTRIASFVIYNLYSACISITEKYAETTPVPKEFSEMVKDLFKTRISSGVIKLIWKYISHLTLYLVDEYAKSENLDLSKVLDNINSKFINPENRCEGPYAKLAAENCYISGVANILEKVRKYVTDSGRFFTVSEPELLLAFNLITPGGYNGNIEEYPGDMKGLIKFFEKKGLTISTPIASKIRQFAQYLVINKDEIDINRILSRIFFFATLVPK